MVTAAGGTSPARSRPVTNGAYYAASVLYQAGFRGWPLTVMTAIAGVESGWNPKSLNNNASTGDSSAGLTQINYFGNLAASRTQQYGSQASLLANPSAQGAATYSLAGGNALSGLSNWGGGNWSGQSGAAPSFSQAGYSQSFLAHLPQAAAATAQVGQFGPAPASATAQVSNWPGTTGSPAVNTGYSTTQTTAQTLSSASSGCAAYVGSNPAAPNQIITIPHTSVGLTMCNWKAIKGGALLAIGVGGAVFAVALVVIAGLGTKTPVGRAVNGALGARAGGAARGAASSDPTPTAAELGGSPTRAGSASSHAKPRSEGPSPFTEADETIPRRNKPLRETEAA